MTVRALQWSAPFVIALHTPLFLLSHNIAKTPANEACDAAATSLLLAAVSLVLARRLVSSRAKAVALASGVMTWFFWFAVFSSAVHRAAGATPAEVGEFNLALIPWTILAALYVVAVLRARSADLLAQLWVIVAIVLVAAPALVLLRFGVTRPPTPRPFPAVALRAPERMPDIFFLVFDRYAGAETLLRRYRFDNSGFIDHLRGRGFSVAERSHANYQRTAHSLAATLNLEFIHPLYTGMEHASDWRPLYALVRDHRVGRSLRALGYEYVNAGAWWPPTRHPPLADVNLSFAPFSSVLHAVYENSALAGSGFSFAGMLDVRRTQWQRIHRQVREIGRIRRRARPVFVFAHFLLPHDPYVFGARGEFVPSRVAKERGIARNYIEQVQFANVVIRQLVDDLLAELAEPRPVIIIQADEGPFPPYEESEVDLNRYDWRRARPDEVREKFGILNAMYVPDAPRASFNAAMTPINTFRIVFNTYFGQDLKLLPDRSFGSVSDVYPYGFFEVTDLLNAG
ncbi:MAG TPA: hypothetical protein VNN07_11715 [Candidatus Tectomicrobia bacterium]|nr:hypothetical protein [Candidatus Tectomicrobia bacterium]